jgi:capsular polysaccharide export protein
VSRRRSFLFLQGVCSPFFKRLADKLRSDGHRVHKINFNGGDIAYWGCRPAWSFHRGVDALPDFLEKKYRRFGITDQILFGDRRPVHRAAIELAERLDVRTYVFEEGYFRPYWVTLEYGGVNSHSRLPRDPAWFFDVGPHMPDGDASVSFQSSFFKRALHDVVYHMACAADPVLFPSYRTHASVNAMAEYYGYLRRLSQQRTQERKDGATIENLFKSAVPFFFLPLQLNSDAQIRDHSSFKDMTGVMAFVMASFASNAPGDARLVIKNHPLEMGASDYPLIIAELKKRFGLEGRVDYLDTGDLMVLLKYSRGVVTVNSTAGGLSLQLNRPTIALSDPIYNIAGLTYQGKLDDFWRATAPPDATLFRYFRNTVIHTTQVNGGFYCDAGIKLAVENSMRLLNPDHPALEALL